MLGLRGAEGSREERLYALTESAEAIIPRASQRSYRERFSDHTESAEGLSV